MESVVEILDAIKEYCKQEIHSVPYMLWLNDVKAVAIEDDNLIVSVTTDFRKQILEEKHLDMLIRIYRDITGLDGTVLVKSEGIVKSAAEEEVPQYETEYTFDTFIIGPSNKFAHAASLAVATNPSSAYNPLFIYGNSGLGKTHLLNAICTEILRNKPGSQIIYAQGESFMNELILAIQTNTTFQFHEKYRRADVLLVDDIQFIGGKESTQEEFFHTFNTLYHAGKQIVLASDRPPKEIRTLEDRLRTRFESGLLADISTPDFETRVAIIRKKAEVLELDLKQEVAEYIASKIKSNIRQLEGVVKRIKAYWVLASAPPSITTAQSSIRDILSDGPPTPVLINNVIDEVSRYYGVDPDDMRSQKRTGQISLARQVAMFILREITDLSMANIGEEFNGRDHSTVVYAVGQVEKLIKKDAVLKSNIEDMTKNVIR